MLNLLKAKQLAQPFFPEDYFSARVQKFAPVPAYLFHQIDGDFEQVCSEIHRLGVETLTFSDLIRTSPSARSAVLLTMDDGWSSVWSVAFPLARRYGIRFTLFVVPHAMEDSEECRPTLENGADIECLVARDHGPRCMLTWGEVRAMYESGLVDVQSHSLNHGVVFSSDELVGFTTPDGPFPLWGHAPLVTQYNGADVMELRPQLGSPLYAWGHALAAPRRFIDNAGVREECVAFVRENGGVDFFKAKHWRKALQSLVGRGDKGTWESQAERRERYRADLTEAKRLIEEHLPGATVCALAPPWSMMHSELPEIAQETGHKVVVLGYPFEPLSTDSSVVLYPRFFADAIWLLLHGKSLRGLSKWWRSRSRAIQRRVAGEIP